MLTTIKGDGWRRRTHVAGRSTYIHHADGAGVFSSDEFHAFLQRSTSDAVKRQDSVAL